jgi:hypothetical protein
VRVQASQTLSTSRPVRQRDTRPPLDTTFFQVVRARGATLGPDLQTYFRTVIGIDPTSDRLDSLRMEEVFKDVFYDFQDAPTDTTMRGAYIDLVELYLRILGETTNWLCEDGRNGAPIGRLISAAARHADDLAIITFNHDLVIENEISRRAQLRSRWCLDEGYGTIGPTMTPAYPSPGVQQFELHSAGGCDHSRPIRILKLHGSLNWVVRLSGARPAARTLSGQSSTREQLLLTSRIQPSGRVTWGRARTPGRGRNLWYLWPVVVPPVYAKQALRNAVESAWHDARLALEEADRVVFFGYSLPLIDVEAEKLVERSLARNSRVKWLDVVDPGPASAARYAGLAPGLPVRWYSGLEAFFAADDLAA